MKRGQGGPSEAVTIVLIVVAIIVGSIIIALLFFGKIDIRDVAANSACSFSTSGRTMGKIGPIYLIPELCVTRPETIYPNDWDSCSNYKELKEKNYEDFDKDKSRYFNGCAAEQMAYWMTECWKLRGEGGGNPGSFECFSVCISEDEFTDLLKAKYASAQEDYDLKFAAHEEAKEIEDEDLREWRMQRTKNELDTAEAKLDTAEDEYLDAVNEGHPSVSISMEDIIRVMSFAKADGDTTYLEILPKKRIGVAQYWDDIIPVSPVSSPLRALKDPLRAVELKRKMGDGQVISIWFYDGLGTPDSITLKYKTTC